MARLKGSLSGAGGLSGSLSGKGVNMSGSVTPHYDAGPVEPYDGPYEFTPTNTTQTIPIRDKQAMANITIKPIPNNYGLITWNGSTLTVS